MLNKIFLMGRLARDPELRRTQTGTPVASFRLAVDRDFKDRNTGERGHRLDRRGGLAPDRRVCQPLFHQGPHGRGGGPAANPRLDRQRRQQAHHRRGGGRPGLLWRLQAGRRRRRLWQFRLFLRRLLGRRICFLRRLFRPGRARGTPPALAPPAGGDQFAELSDDDGELPF